MERYYNIAYHQKLSFAHTNSILTEYGFLNTGSTSHKIKLMDQYNLLDDEGNIQEHKIMLSVQEQEARKMRWDVPSLKEFLENSQYGYNFKMEETPLESLMEEYFSKEDIASASESLKETRRSMNACFSEY